MVVASAKIRCLNDAYHIMSIFEVEEKNILGRIKIMKFFPSVNMLTKEGHKRKRLQAREDSIMVRQRNYHA